MNANQKLYRTVNKYKNSKKKKILKANKDKYIYLFLEFVSVRRSCISFSSSVLNSNNSRGPLEGSSGLFLSDVKSELSLKSSMTKSRLQRKQELNDNKTTGSSKTVLSFFKGI